VQANGKVSVATGIGTQGQGHFTASRRSPPISSASTRAMSTS
jgi:hypothetical protein